MLVYLGAVQPVGEPLTSQFQKEIVGVLQKFMLTEHRLVWNSLARTWWVLYQKNNTMQNHKPIITFLYIKYVELSQDGWRIYVWGL